MGIEDRPEFDAGVEGVSGSPDISSTILTKIDKCGIFFGDLTLVTSYETEEDQPRTKRSPNPNVFFELGYAAVRQLHLSVSDN